MVRKKGRKSRLRRIYTGTVTSQDKTVRLNTQITTVKIRMNWA
jgi:hypothetical protein